MTDPPREQEATILDSITRKYEYMLQKRQTWSYTSKCHILKTPEKGIRPFFEDEVEKFSVFGQF